MTTPDEPTAEASETQAAPEVPASKVLTRRAQDIYLRVREENPLGEFYQENPYRAMAIAAGIGYVVGGGLFTPFSRFLIRMGVRAVVVPMAAAQIKNLAQGPDDL